MPITQQAISVFDAIDGRRSIRAFRPDLVPASTLRELLEIARRSPSWANTQPCEVAVVTGKPLAALKEGYSAKLTSGADSTSDIPWAEFAGAYRERQRANGLALFAHLGIGRADTDKRNAYYLAMRRFFGAPAAFILYLDKQLGPWSMLDLGIFAQTLMLAAVGRGLGTVPMAMIARHPEVIREVIGIPESKSIICTVAVGYVDEQAEINQFRSERAPLDDFVTWYGGEG